MNRLFRFLVIAVLISFPIGSVLGTTIDELSSGDATASSTSVLPASVGGVTKKLTVGASYNIGLYKNMADAYGLATITGAGTYALTGDIAPTGKITHLPGVVITLGAYDIDLSGATFEAGDYQCFAQTSTGAVTGLRYAKPVWFNAKGDGGSGGGTDDYAPLTATLGALTGAKPGVLDLNGKIYWTSGLTPPDDITIKNGTLFLVTGAGNLVNAEAITNLTLDNVVLMGNWSGLTFTYGSSEGTRVGLKVRTGDAAEGNGVKVINSVIRDFTGSAIEVRETGSSPYHGQAAMISNSSLLRNYNGVKAHMGGEYAQITNSTVAGGKFGLYVNSGNFIATGNNINDNVVGAYLGVDAGANDGHGILANNNFNHNTTYSIWAKDITNGMSFSGNHIYYGDILLDNATGVNIENGQIGSLDILLDGGGFNYIRNNGVKGDVRVYHNYDTSTDYTTLTGNYYMQSGGDIEGNLVTGWTNSGTYAYETFSATKTQLAAINSSGYGYCNSNAIAGTTGHTYEVKFYLVKNSGATPTFYCTQSADMGGTVSKNQACSEGANSFTFTAGTDPLYCGFQTGDGAAANFTVASFVLRDITP